MENSLLLGEVSVSRETTDRLHIYESLLRRWNSKINLVAPSTLEDVWNRHFVDSAQLWPLRPASVLSWLDLGSGAGFPGLIIAILAEAASNGPRVTLVESDLRKSAFLNTVLRETGVSARVVSKRIENADLGRFDVVSARALAPLPKLLSLSAPYFGPDTVGLFPKGAGAELELAEALAFWRFSVQKVVSRTDPRGVILKVGELSHA